MNFLKLGAIILISLHLPSAVHAQAGSAINGTFSVKESWTVMLHLGRGVNKTYHGTEQGTVVINEGAYELLNHSGAGGIGRLDTTRTIDSSGGDYQIDGAYPLAALASGPDGFYAIVPLTFFVIKIRIGSHTGFSFTEPNRSEPFTTRGATLSSLSGSGYSVDVNAPSDESNYLDGLDASSTASLALAGATAPRITAQPQSRIVEAGSDVVFSVSAAGTTPLSYQWRRGTMLLSDGENISGATGPVLTLGNAQSADAGSYSAVVSNAKGSMTSGVATLRIGATLNLLTNGMGTVKPNLNGQLLEVGRSYTLAANPGAGFVFSNWTGDLPPSLSPRLTFTMQSNLTLSANFVLNPFPPVRGAYTGLFHEEDTVRHGSSGLFTLATTDAGAYSGALTLAGVKLPVSGRFDLEGGATNFISRRGIDPVSVAWAVDLHGANQVTGIVSTASWRATLVGDRRVFNARTNAATLAGRYTFVLPGATHEAAKPAGDGFGTSGVNAGGKVSFSGTLADGTKFTAGAPLSQNGMFPFYTALYGKRGSVLSWVAFDTNQPSDDLHGLLSWIRPPGTTPKSYTNGFEFDSPLTGSRYRPPIGSTNRIVGITNGLVIRSGGGLPGSFANAVILGVNNKLTNFGPDRLAVTFKPASGLFTGTWMPTGTTARVRFGGAVLQKAYRGSGYFLRTNESGRVEFEPAP